jgi:hypothetical protein
LAFVGRCIGELGMGFREAVYKETLELEFEEKIPYEREMLFKIGGKAKHCTVDLQLTLLYMIRLFWR